MVGTLGKMEACAPSGIVSPGCEPGVSCTVIELRCTHTQFISSEMLNVAICAHRRVFQYFVC